MNWLINFLFKSSIGQKVVMSLSGLFLIIFLVVHLLGNLQLLSDDGGMSFNTYTYFMTHNPVIKLVSYLLYLTILLHTIQGLGLWLRNRKAKGQGYAVTTNTGSSYFARYMAAFGIIIFIFLLIHMWQFWFQMKFGNLDMVNYPGKEHSYKDLYTPVKLAFAELPYVIFYVLSMFVVSFHLIHGFQSAFQSLGINHKKYTPAIKAIGWAYAILVPVGFAILPIYMYIIQNS